MNMYDKSYCNANCKQRDCLRNMKYNKPQERYYSVSNFENNDNEHKNCAYKIKMKG